MMWCCRKKSSPCNETVVINGFKQSNSKTEILSFANQNYKSTAELVEDKTKIETNGTTAQPNTIEETDVTQNELEPSEEKESNKKPNKLGVTWAANIEENKNDHEQASRPLSVPTIIIEQVDASETSDGISKSQFDEIKETLKSIDKIPSSPKDNRSSATSTETTPQPSPKIYKKQTSLEVENAEYRRVSLHLHNVADHIHKLGSLIDRFDGVFVPLLQDEIKANLKCCKDNVTEVECEGYGNLIHRQEIIQKKIDQYIVMLDEKSRQTTAKPVKGPKKKYSLETADSEMKGLNKIKAFEEKVNTLCEEIDALNGVIPKVVYNESVETLQLYLDEADTMETVNSMQVQAIKAACQEKIQKYLQRFQEELVP